MYDMTELEEQWKQYHRKRRRSVYFKLILILLFVLLFYFLTPILLTFVKSYFGNVPKAAQPKSDRLSKKPLKGKEHAAYSIVINGRIAEIEKRTKKERVESVPPTEEIIEIPILDGRGERRSSQKHSVAPPSASKRVVKTEKESGRPIQRAKKPTLKIRQISDMKAYKEVEKRFERSHNIDDALFLAEVYYKKGEYKKAEYWALQTNKIDNTIDKSWIIFAKSKFKQGQKHEAIRILEAYLKRLDSEEAKKLLLKWKM